MGALAPPPLAGQTGLANKWASQCSGWGFNHACSRSSFSTRSVFEEPEEQDDC